jgi:site-specific recombinase XerD
MRSYSAPAISRFTPAEADALIAACSATSRTGIRNRAPLTVMYRGGLRIAEVLALKVSDVDPGRGTIRVLHGKGNRARTVGFDPDAMAVVQRWADARRAAGIRGGTLFCTLAGGGVSDKYVRALLRPSSGQGGCREAGPPARVQAHARRRARSRGRAGQRDLAPARPRQLQRDRPLPRPRRPGGRDRDHAAANLAGARARYPTGNL